VIKIHRNRTPEDARQVIRDYAFDRYDYVGGIGTAEGFANRLFAPGVEMTRTELAAAFCDYLTDCCERGTDEVDREWRQRADEMQATLHRRACKRQEAADFIRHVKFTAPGGSKCWDAVAALATTADRGSLLSSEAFDDYRIEELEALLSVLLGLETLEPLFPSWYALPYRPGQNGFVDDCLRLDIARFDITLETADPSTGQDEDWFDEASALLRLAKDVEVRKELSALIETVSNSLRPPSDREVAAVAGG
jgi:hypothetical protein